MNKKVLAISLLVTTVIIGIGAVFIGMYLQQQPTTPQELTAEIPSWCTPISGGRCACYDGTNCCNGDGTYCSGDICSIECLFVGIEDQECSLGLMTYCDYDDTSDGINCVDAPQDCECDCDANVPVALPGEDEIYHGTDIANCATAERTVRYQSLCNACNNVYFCIACFGTLEITETPTPTITVTGSITITPSKTLTPTTSRTVTPSTTRSTTPSTTPTLPITGIFDNGIDTMIIGIIMISFGIVLYKSGAYIKLGDLYWDQGGRNISEGINSTNEMMINVLDNIGIGLINIDRTILYFLHQMKINIKLTALLIYNNIILIKEKVITGILTMISKILNILILFTIKFKKGIKILKGVIRSINIRIQKRLRRIGNSYESNVIDDRKDSLD